MGLESFQSQASLRVTTDKGNAPKSLWLSAVLVKEKGRDQRIYIEFSGKNTFIFILKLKCS